MKELEYAKDLIDKARNNIDKAEDQIKLFSNYSNIISWCQAAIELSAKAIFKIMHVNYPKDHQLLFDKTKVKNKTIELLAKEFPKSIDKEEVIRVLFLTYFWNEFYTLAKYGIAELDFPPSSLFRREEAELAIEHAKECVYTADSLYWVKINAL